MADSKKAPGAKKPDGNKKSPAKLLVLAVLAIGGLGGIIYDASAKAAPKGSKAKAAADASTIILVPDHDGANKLIAASEGARTGPEPRGSADAGSPMQQTQQTQQTLGGAAANVKPEEAAAARLERLYEEQDLKHLLALREQQLELRRKAIVAPSGIKEFAEVMRSRDAESAALLESLGSAEGGGSPMADMMGPLRALAAVRSGSGGAPGAGGGEQEGAGAGPPGGSDDKREFFQHGSSQLEPGMLAHKVQKQQSPYELHMGDVIPGVLVSGISTDAPGQIIGQVSEDVCDSTSGDHLLIPQGSRLVGTYSASVSQGQTRVQVAWVRLRMPNGDRLDLDGMSGADQLGIAGFHDRVNRHIGALLAAALMTTAFTVAYELATPPTGSYFGNAVSRGVGESIVQLGTNIAQQRGRIPPTLEIRPGYRFNIMVQKDVRFEGPYRGAGRGTTSSCASPGEGSRR